MHTGVGCPALLQGIFLTQGSNLHPLTSPALTDGFFTTSTTWEALSEVHQPVILLKLSTSQDSHALIQTFISQLHLLRGYPILLDSLHCSVVPRRASSFHVSASLLLQSFLGSKFALSSSTSPELFRLSSVYIRLRLRCCIQP